MKEFHKVLPGRPVTFVGFPSYLQGQRGVVERRSDLFPDMLVVVLANGSTVLTEDQHVEEVCDG